MFFINEKLLFFPNKFTLLNNILIVFLSDTIVFHSIKGCILPINVHFY